MRYLSIFTLLVASSSLASASIISGTCTPGGLYGGGTGTITYACNGATVGAGFQIIAGSLTLGVNYLNGGAVGTNTFQVSIPVPGFSPNPLVGASSGGSGSTPVTFVTSTLNAVPFADGVSLTNFTVTGTGSTTSGSVAAGSGTLSYSYTVEAVPNNGQIPEPTTLALVGGVLVLAGIRKFRS